MDWVLAKQLAVSLALGLLVGFQREWTAPHVAGIRTFACITVFGTVLGTLRDTAGGWLPAAGLLAVAGMLIAGGMRVDLTGDPDPGITTQVAALLMYAVGVVIALDRLAPAILVGGGTAVLLHWKRPIHGFVDRIGEKDIRAIIRLVLIGAVILPVLPRTGYGPYGVLNPFEIWLMVVLIVGISLGGYIGYKFLGARAGSLLGGVLGGVISSTATTVSYARRARRTPGTSGPAALVVAIASTVVFVRVLFEIAVTAPDVLPRVAGPLVLLLGLMAAASAALYVSGHEKLEPPDLDEDPSELGAAVVFGALYAAVLFAVAMAREHLGDRGLYVIAALSGLTDMDAITLSTTQMIHKGRLDVEVGWRMIVLGGMSNLAFKGAAVAALGSRGMLVRVAAAFGVALLGGALLLAFWP
jgi:uncharacterized membrane protein (DUF4010 family)